MNKIRANWFRNKVKKFTARKISEASSEYGTSDIVPSDIPASVGETVVKPRGYRLIVTIVNRGFETTAMDAAREAGATGGTLVNARGAGAREAEKLFGIAVQPEKEFVLILSSEESCSDIMRAVIDKVGLNTLGAGICFTLPVDDVLGVARGINQHAAPVVADDHDNTPAEEVKQEPAQLTASADDTPAEDVAEEPTKEAPTSTDEE